ncbi:HlyD family type I secretion periplasmic adaptor subunit [Halarcobacter anaerophilus]|uniref:HlyD family type I secretion periplasmic adaptor subunit n=1 Tax=Halarcobacter anaerophilus TaxID=877500 RepID=UPI0005CB53F5|nr:HlyD family type I secretion periplasmic adaptor subunit [Halarcobacter anaerophilus]
MDQIQDDELTKSFRFQNRELLDNYVILAVTNKEGIIKHVSTQMCLTFKYKPSDLLNKPYTFLIKKDSIQTFNNQFDDAKDLKTIWKGEVKHASSSDHVIWTDTVITPLFNDKNEHIGFILASHDITKEKTLKRINEENLLKKRYNKAVLDFMPSLSSAVLLRASSGLHKVLWIITFTIVFLLTWAYFSKIDDIVKTQGKIITTTNIQTISSLNGGTLKEIYVKEGNHVKKGDVLFKLSDLDYKKDFEKNRQNRMSLLAKIARLKAQSEGKEIVTNKEVASFDNTIMQNEIELFHTNEKKFAASINVLKEQLIQRQNDLSDAYKNLEINETNFKLIENEMKIKKPLVEERIISKVELLQLERTKNDTLSEIKKIRGSIPTLKSAINEIKKSIEETTQSYRSSSKDELVVAANDLRQVKEDINFLSQKITETIIKSPNDGVVNKINIKTKGEAVSPGTVIAEIIPESKYALAEVKVDPGEIGFLYVGQHARIKLRPYDFSLYGAADGEISYISADTLIDEKDEKKEVYIVHIKANTKYLNNNKKLEIKPGMSVDVDIITGKKSILDYIFKPIVRSLEI